MGRQKRILIIGDDPDLIEALQLTLRGNYEACAAGAQEGLRRVVELSPDLIILDASAEVPAWARQVPLALRSCDPDSEYAGHARTPILTLTPADQPTQSAVAPAGDGLTVDGVLHKPVTPGALLAAVKRLLATARLHP